MGSPEHFQLYSNFPNPFNAGTTIHYSLHKAADVLVQVYSPTGKWISTLFQGHQNAGKKNIFWDGTDERGREVSSGIYLCRIGAGSEHRSMKMLLVR